jgi:ribonuclease J
MIRKRQDKIPNLPQLDLTVVEKETSVTLGDLTIEFFGIKKESPSELGLVIKTPYGDIVHHGTLKLNNNNATPSVDEEERYKLFENRNTLLLMADSTSAENPGYSISDTEIALSIDSQMKDVKTRLTVMTFSSQIERLLPVIASARKYGRKIAVDSKSILTSLIIADAMKLVTLDKETFINIEDIDSYKDEEILVLLSGEIGEEFNSLVKIVAEQHKYLRICERDTVLMATVEIMGLRRPLQNLKDKLSRQGAHLIHYKTSDVHSSGHANSEELAWIHNKIHPKFFIPVHGYHYMLRVHADIERKLGMSESNIIIPDNGMIIEIRDEGRTITSLKERAPGEMIVVDGATVGKIQDVVMRDRQALAEDGMFVVIGVIDSHTHSLKKSPDLISRGFVYLKESQDLLYQTRLLTKKVIEDSLAKGGFTNLDQMKQDVAEATTKFLLQKTAKRPVIIPVIISV